MIGLNTIGEMELLRLARDRLEDLCQTETNEEQRIAYAEQYEELEDCIRDRERISHNGAISGVTRLKVDDIFGSWYYQKISYEDEDEGRKIHVFNLYDADGSFVDEFRNIGSMKSYVRTGRR